MFSRVCSSKDAASGSAAMEVDGQASPATGEDTSITDGGEEGDSEELKAALAMSMEAEDAGKLQSQNPVLDWLDVSLSAERCAQYMVP